MNESDPKSLFPYELINFTLSQFGTLNHSVLSKITNTDEYLVTLINKLNTINFQNAEDILHKVVTLLNVYITLFNFNNYYRLPRFAITIYNLRI